MCERSTGRSRATGRNAPIHLREAFLKEALAFFKAYAEKVRAYPDHAEKVLEAGKAAIDFATEWNEVSTR